MSPILSPILFCSLYRPRKYWTYVLQPACLRQSKASPKPRKLLGLAGLFMSLAVSSIPTQARYFCPLFCPEFLIQGRIKENSGQIMLTDTEIKKLKATGKEYQKADSGGLAIVVRSKGDKFWRYEFRFNGKKEKYGYGNYPEISLIDARKIHAVARQLVALNQHPATLLDDPEAKKMIIDGHGVKTLEEHVKAAQENAAQQTLMTFGEAADIYRPNG